MEKESFKGKITQILLETKVFFEEENPTPLTQEKLKSLGLIVSKRSKKLNPNVYNLESEYIINHSDKIGNVNQLEDMIYEHCRSVGWSYNEDGFIVRNLVPERTYKEGKYKKIAEEIFPLITAYKSC